MDAARRRHARQAVSAGSLRTFEANAPELLPSSVLTDLADNFEGTEGFLVNERIRADVRVWMQDGSESSHGRTLDNAQLGATALSTLPVVMVFLLAQRQFIEGLSRAGLKG